MKKLLILFSVLLSITSCRYDGDILFGYTEEEQNFGQSFIKEFGSFNTEVHSWDYYKQYSTTEVTRASEKVVIVPTTQPTDITFTKWQNYLKAGEDNRNIGTHNYKLKSNGTFTINAIWYCGWYEGYQQFDFEFGIKYNKTKYKLFGGLNLSGNPVNYTVENCPWATNPTFASNVTIPTNDSFIFYMSYVDANGKKIEVESNTGNSTLLYTKVENGEEIMIIGFEDKLQSIWNTNAPDFNDVVLYIQGKPNLPIIESKRFFCEDLSDASNSDFDYNDVVFDVHPLDESTEVIIRALGGTLPIKLYVGGYCIGNDDLHKIMKTNHVPANTGYILNVPIYKTTIPLEIKDLSNFTDVYVKVGADFKKKIPFRNNSIAPAIIAVPIKTKWMIEFTDIKFGYPNFFSENWYNKCNDEYTIDK